MSSSLTSPGHGEQHSKNNWPKHPVIIDLVIKEEQEEESWQKKEKVVGVPRGFLEEKRIKGDLERGGMI